jgi:hypothetical protein
MLDNLLHNLSNLLFVTAAAFCLGFGATLGYVAAYVAVTLVGAYLFPPIYG